MVKNTCALGLNATSHPPSLAVLIRNLQQMKIKLQAKPLTQKFKHILSICLLQKKNPISQETNDNVGAQENSIISVNEKKVMPSTMSLVSMDVTSLILAHPPPALAISCCLVT